MTSVSQQQSSSSSAAASSSSSSSSSAAAAVTTTAANASQPPTTTTAAVPSYATTAKKAAIASPPIVTGTATTAATTTTTTTTPSPAVAIGAAASASPVPPAHHGKGPANAPLNGSTIIAASTTMPVIASSGGSATNGAAVEHNGKNAVTISAHAPNSLVNGGPVGGGGGGVVGGTAVSGTTKAGNIPQFGSITDSPALSHSAPQVSHAATAAAMSLPKSGTSIPSPAQSPSPIPIPSATGGARPPSGLSQQGGMTFGSLGRDSDRHMPHGSPAHHSPATAVGHPHAHARRESSHSMQSMHNDMGYTGAGSGRGAFSGRGSTRGGHFNGNSNNFQPGQQGFPPAYRSQPQNRASNAAFAPAHANRPYSTQPPPPPHTARSPAMQNATPNPTTPSMGQAMPMAYGGAAYGHAQQMPHYPVQHHSHYAQPSSSKFHGANGRHAAGKRSRDQSSSDSRPRESARERHGPSGTASWRGAHAQVQRGNPADRRGPFPPDASGRDRTHLADAPTMAAHMVDRHALGFPPLPSRVPPRAPSSRAPASAGPAMDLSPASGNFERFLMQQQGAAAAAYGGYQFAQQYAPQMPYMQGYGGPQPMAFPHQPMMPGMHPAQYRDGYPAAYAAPQQAQAMSRNASSQMSDPRPGSGAPPASTPSLPSQAPQSAPAPVSTPFVKAPRKSAAVIIKRPEGGQVDVSNLKASSPAPKEAKTPPIITSTPTPPPPKAVALPAVQHARQDSVVKTSEEIKNELAEKIQAAAKAAESPAKEATHKPVEVPSKSEEPAQAAPVKDSEAEPAAEEQKTMPDAEAKAKPEEPKDDEEDELERQIREMEEAEAERERKEEELMTKRAKEKAAADKLKEENRAAEAADNDRKLREAEKEMERLEDERARKREQAEAEAQAKSADQEPTKKEEEKPVVPTTPSTLASKLSTVTLGTDSGASTPVSDDSMGPPSSKGVAAASAEKRGKPAALNLATLNAKPVEPPQPSAALQSLKSARFLTHINPSLYPSNISSPNPALNAAVTAKGKSFKYDKEFLLQFKQVFTEKPSLEFESQIKALLGDGDSSSSRGGSSRGPSSNMSRGGSQRGAAGGGGGAAGGMGAFTSVGGRTLPPGTTSEQRMAMSSGAMPRPTVNPMASFSRPGGSFPGGNPMSRTPSTSGMHAIPQSPRQQSRSTRGNSRRENPAGNARAEAAAAKVMPLTAGQELKPIAVTATGWKPRSIGQNSFATGAAGPAPGGANGTHMEPDMVQRKVKAALNKMTPEKFDKIADQILAIAAQSKDEADGRTLRQVIQLTFEKATDEAHWASMYAKFCKRMLETMSPDIKDETIKDKNGNIVFGGSLFRKYLLNRCQEEFERGWQSNLPEKPDDDDKEKSAEAAMLSDEYYIAAAAKRRGLGLVQFIGELYKLGMLTERIMHECVKKLVDYTGVPEEAEIESLTKLLRTIGGNLDSTERGVPMMDVYFQRIKSMIDTPELPSRVKFMLMDVVDLRKNRWQSKEANKGPKTLDEVREEAEAAAQAKAAENARSNVRGGGGRMQLGRGDSRQFSNQYSQQPPPDYQRNNVAADDLRRLTNKGGLTRSTGATMSFGPTSMFASRSNSGRKMGGPGGALSRGGEDSGASSRTGTPPQPKEKESATSANAFSLLAVHGADEPENPASPPSTSVSPALAKVTPTKAEEKKEGESGA